MPKRFLPVLLIVLIMVSALPAAALEVAEGAITTAVEDHAPVDRIAVYPADYGKLYCFTRIIGAQDDTRVTHVWYYQDTEMARVSLPVRSANWRTYSSKRFLPQWAGDWKVVVLDAEDQPLTTLSFRLE